jgi:uncharacterized protein YabN with tetrapyrrole methylase and pyrophosphatase domain
MNTLKSKETAETNTSWESKENENNASNAKRGSLVIIGTGIRTVGQLTIEAIAWMKEADSLLYIVSDPIAESVIHKLNPQGAESITKYYEVGELRSKAYEKMVVRILESVRSGKKTVAAFYGHPGVFAFPSHESIRRARKEGYSARMLPGISSEDCLFADLGVDPGNGGCQSYEATDFLLNVTMFDPTSQLILWQIGILCDWSYQRSTYNTKAIPLLVNRLARYYPLTHRVTVYEAARLTGTDPVIERISLRSLVKHPLTPAKTLYVPPVRARIPDPEVMSYFMYQRR